MQKDVVYIDVEDDITAIIGKVKSSKEKIVALVPPKRVGVLQSAVNLRLITRAAHGSHKHLVLITNNHALIALAAAAKIPVAKNLQSKPEIAEIPALQVDDDDDIIDGESLPESELAKSKSSSSSVPDDAVEDLDIDDDTPKASPPGAHSSPSKPRVKSGVKVPSFDIFRKKLFLFIGLGILLLAFLIWAIFFAAKATVVIDARTTPTDVKTSVAIGPTLATDAETSTLKSVQIQDKKSSAIEFDATGTQDVGEKATGTVTFSTNSISALGTTIPAGTQLTSSGGFVFITNQSVTLTLSNYQGAPASVTAAASGPQYNGASGGLSGAPSGVSAQLNGSTAGGTEKIIKIVLQADVEKAKAQLVAQNNDDIKKQMASKFDKNTIIIEDSFQATPASPASAPAIGQESKDGKAKLTSEVTYTMSGVTKGDLSAYLKSALEKQMNRDEQRVYSDGLKSAKLTDFKATNGNTTVALAATGRIGPKIEDDEIKELVKGKQFGDIQTELKKIEGVNDAETKFWPFWVNTVPRDSNKIKIEFKLQDESK